MPLRSVLRSETAPTRRGPGAPRVNRGRGLLLAVVFATPAVSARSHALEEAWRWAAFTVESGLPSNEVVDVVETEDGGTWAITSGGLAWYDGWEWHAVGREGGLVPEAVVAVAAPGGGLVVLQAGRVHRESGRVFHPENFALDGRPLLVTSLAAAPESPWGPGLLLIGRPGPTDPVLLAFAGRTGLARIEPPASVAWPASLRTTRRAAWLDTRRGTFRLGAGGFECILPPARYFRHVDFVVEGLSGAGAVSIQFPPEERGTWTWQPDGAPRMDPEAGGGFVGAMDVLPTGDLLQIFQTGDAWLRRGDGWMPLTLPTIAAGPRFVRARANGDLWIGTEAGLFLVRLTSKRWTTWRHPGPVPLNRVHDIALARDGTAWIATAGGLERRDPDGAVTVMDRAGGNVLHDVTGVAEDESGSIWIVSGNSFTGALRWDGTSWRRFGATDGLVDGYIHRVVRDRKGRLLFLCLTDSEDHGGTRSPGVLVRDGDRFGPLVPEEAAVATRIYGFAEGPGGESWLATGEGLVRQAGNARRAWTLADGLARIRITTVTVDRDGTAWFGDQASGLGFIGKDGRPGRLRMADGLLSDEVWEVETGPRGELWVATRGGLSCRRDGRWAGYRAAAGLVPLGVWPLVVTEDRVYAGTAGGGTAILDLTADAGEPPRVAVAVDVLHEDAGHFARVRWRVSPWWGEQPAGEYVSRWRIDDGPWSAWTRDRAASVDVGASGPHEATVEVASIHGDRVVSATSAFAIDLPAWRRPALLVPLGLAAAASLGLAGTLAVRHGRDVAALRRSEDRFRSLFENATDFIGMLDRTGRVVTVNKSAERLTGRRREALAGLPLADLVAPGHRPRVAALVEDALRDGSASVRELDVASGDGGTHALEVSARAVRDEAGHVVVQLVGRDVSERREAEAERLRMERHLLEVQKLESLGVLAGGVAHDFNNLLLAVVGNAELAQMTTDAAAPTQVHLQRIVTAATRAADLTQQLLACAGKAHAVVQPVDLDVVIRETVDLLRVSLPRRARILLGLAGDLPPVDGDPSQLRQVVMNLVVNAGEALGDDEGTVGVATHRDGGSVRLVVSDTGMGMSPDVIQRAFEPFYSTKFAGRGLGLAAVQGIVRGHGGTIAVTSAEGSGTTFTVVLPASTRARLPEPAGEPAAMLRATGVALVVDDEERVLQVTADALSGMGFEVLTASDGAAAVETFRAHADRVEIVVLDLVMPGLTGDRVLDELRGIKADVRVLLVSGYDEGEARRLGRAMRPAPFLQKPYRVGALAAAIRDLLQAPA